MTMFCLPVKSHAIPKRGPHCRPRFLNRYLSTQVPAWQMPWNGTPVPGTSRPISNAGKYVFVGASYAERVLFAGLIAGWYRRGALAGSYKLGMNVEACSDESY